MKKHNLTLSFLLFITLYNTDYLTAQTTFVPDDNFEQRLIDLGKDDVLDNYVLTANINTIFNLNVQFKGITDLTGIEDFAGLKYLYCGWNSLTSLDVSQNTLLEELYVSDDSALKNLDVSNNTALKYLYCQNSNLCTLNVKNGNNVNFTNLNTLNNLNLACIEVDGTGFGTSNVSIDAHTSLSENCPGVPTPTLTFVDNTASPFISLVSPLYISLNVTTKSKAYFYYYVEENCELPPVDVAINDNIINDDVIPFGVKYLGDGVLQCWLDLTTSSFNVGKVLIVSIPTSVSENGLQVNLTNTPPDFAIQLTANPKTQNIDVFAGGSAGANLLLGGVGAGPSVAAAEISLTGTGGMGLKFEQDESGDEKITRRFEAGIGASLKFPSINVVLDVIKAGVETGVTIKGIKGQTMSFPNTLNTDISKKAKAAYLLETFALGGIELSPYASIFLLALQNSLVESDPDLSVSYSGLKYSNQGGASVEGSLSVGLNFEFGDTKFDIVGAGGSNTFSYLKVNKLQEDIKTVKFAYAIDYNESVLDLNVGDVDLGSAFVFKEGAEVSFTAGYDATNTMKDFTLSFGMTEQDQITLANHTRKHSYDFIVPTNVIQNNNNEENLIGSAAQMIENGPENYPMQVGVDYLAENLDVIYESDLLTLGNFANHNIMETKASSAIGVNVNPKISLNAALGIGFGLSLGMQYSYLDELEYKKKQNIVANGMILPMAEYNDVLHSDRIFSLDDEINDLFEGTKLLIDSQLNALVTAYNQAIESGVDFVVDIGDKAITLVGNIATEGKKWVIRFFDPTTNRVFSRGESFTPIVRQVYSSRRVLHLNNQSRELENISSTSTLYIVSENVNINLLDINDTPIEVFDPVTLTLPIDQAKVDELEFGDTEKALAKMYRYDDENLIWEELAGDAVAHIDTVATQITKSANYAIGIEFDTANDVTAPEIKGYYPQDGATILPVIDFWAELYEPITAAGIDLSQTMIKIDGVEVASFWYPVDNKISYKPLTPLSEGEHTFEVIVNDLNGNSNSIFSTVTVDYNILSPDIKVLLQGPYDTSTGLMKDDLRNTGNIPTISPYADAISVVATVFNTGGTSGTGLPEDDIVDWVWLEMRDKADGTTVIESRSALLQRDGDVVETDGISPIIINIAFDDYYVMIGHRNHLGIFTSSTINSLGGVVDLDFRSNNDLVTGGINGIKDMGDGSFALYAGDQDGNGQVQSTDITTTIPDIGISGYSNADIDMNSQVQNTDINNVLNPNIGKGEQQIVVCKDIVIDITFDAYANEVTWELRNSSDTVIESGGPWAGGTSSVIESFCLEAGNYTFYIFDSFGDGLFSPGNVTVSTGETVLVFIEGNYGFGTSQSFTLD